MVQDEHDQHSGGVGGGGRVIAGLMRDTIPMCVVGQGGGRRGGPWRELIPRKPCDLWSLARIKAP